MTPHGYRVRPIDTETLQQLRTRDDAGRPPGVRTDNEGGLPLRCCLRASTVGEELALVSYAPLRRWAARRGLDIGAYDEVGPVFIHREPCLGPKSEMFPDEFRHAPRVLRAYNHDGTIRDGVLVMAGGPFEDTLEEQFADLEVAVVHVRAVGFGCFTFAIERTPR